MGVYDMRRIAGFILKMLPLIAAILGCLLGMRFGIYLFS